MKFRPRTTKRSLEAAALAVAFVFALVPLSCYAQDPAPTPTPAAPEAPAAEAPAGEAPAGEPAPRARFQQDKTNYAVKAVSTETGQLEVSVVPKGVYHINLEYPWKFKSADQTYKKDAFKLTETRATLALPGSDATGELRFSICSAQTCLIEKVPLSTTP